MGNNLVDYKDDHSDESIAVEIGNGCVAGSVAGVRKEMFGNLRSNRAIAAETRIDEAVRLMENVTKCHMELKDRYNKLVLLLAINKVADCRHLELK